MRTFCRLLSLRPGVLQERPALEAVCYERLESYQATIDKQLPVASLTQVSHRLGEIDGSTYQVAHVGNNPSGGVSDPHEGGLRLTVC